MPMNDRNASKESCFSRQRRGQRPGHTSANGESALQTPSTIRSRSRFSDFQSATSDRRKRKECSLYRVIKCYVPENETSLAHDTFRQGPKDIHTHNTLSISGNITRFCADFAVNQKVPPQLRLSFGVLLTLFFP